MNADSFSENGERLTPAQKKRRLANQQKWKRAGDRRSRWTPAQFAEEELRLEEEIAEFLESRRVA